MKFGMDARISQFPMRSNGYAAITANTDGFIKVISDSKTSIILGIHMIGEGAVELSSSFVQLLEMAAKVEDIKFPLYAHPGYGGGIIRIRRRFGSDRRFILFQLSDKANFAGCVLYEKLQ